MICPSCNTDKPARAFYDKSKNCRECNREFFDGLSDILRAYYKPTYPPHIQDYLDKRRERLLKQLG